MRSVGVLAVSVAALVAVPIFAIADPAGTRPPGCSSHFKDRDVRERTIDAPPPGALIHEMSNDCAASGPHIGTLSPGSHFWLYYADTVQSYMCYGYSYQIGRNGYVYCASLKVP
jgi:hypothetical protein